MPREYRKFLIVLILILVGVRPLIMHFLDKSVYRGGWYSVKVPTGWEQKKTEDEIIFYTPDENIMTGMPEAFFSVYAKKSDGALFLDDLFVDVLASFRAMKGRVLDKGEIKIDGLVSKWVLFSSEEPELMILTFFVVDDFNRLTRIQFTSHPRGFKKYRSEFEEFKNSFSFKKIF